MKRNLSLEKCVCSRTELQKCTQFVDGRRTQSSAIQCAAREYFVMAVCISRHTAVYTKQNSTFFLKNKYSCTYFKKSTRIVPSFWYQSNKCVDMLPKSNAKVVAWRQDSEWTCCQSQNAQNDQNLRFGSRAKINLF